MAGLLGILATYGIGLVVLDRRAAMVRALALLGVHGYIMVSRQVLPDMILCTSILFSCLGFALCMRSVKPFSRILYLAMSGFASGGRCSHRGTVGCTIPCFFVILVPVGRPEFKRPLMDWLVFVAGLLVAAAIWAIPAYLRDQGVYLRQVLFRLEEV